MNLPAPIANLSERLLAAWRGNAVSLKAVSFALVGVINSAVDYAIFTLLFVYVTPTQTFANLVGALAAAAEPYVADWILNGLVKYAPIIFANVSAWYVAVTGSYVMNSFTTFSTETGRQLRLKDYAGFVGSGVVAVLATTITVIIAAEFMPVLAGKGIAILVSFAVNFSITHFVVFRPRARQRQ
jgi:putative flippase GtrA